MPTYYVATTGNDSANGSIGTPWLTPQKALTTMVAGDTTYCRGGTYNTAPLTNTNSGTAGNYITLQNYPTETVNIIINSSGYIGLSTNSQNYIKVIGLSIDGNGNVSYYDFDAVSGDHIMFQTCYATNCAASGFYAENSTNVTIDGCTANATNTAASEECISFYNVNGFEIKNCIVHDPASTQRIGIDVKNGSKNGTIHNNNVYNISGFGADGIYVDARGTASNIQIYDNLIHDLPNSYGIQVNDESGSGVLSDISIYNNIIYGCSYAFFVIQQGTETYTNIYFINNTCYNNQQTAYEPEIRFSAAVAYTTNCIIRNNIIYSTKASAQAIYDPNDCYTAGKLIVDHNLFYNSGGAWQTTNHNVFGTNTVTSDPLFTNLGSYVFSLQSGSPCRDVGSSLLVPSTDYIGTTRPQGAGYDIGAYEYISGAAYTVYVWQRTA